MKDEKLKKVLKLTWDLVFWIAFIGVAALWIMDYVNTKRELDPQFCLSKNTIEVENGTVDECIGVGYKVFTYHVKDSEVSREFGGFWIEPRK